jgi:adenylate kinase family enzyme
MTDPSNLIDLSKIITEILELNSTVSAEELAELLKKDDRFVQFNFGDSRAFQTVVKGGIANIGTHFHGLDEATTKKIVSALEGLLESSRLVEVPTIDWLRRSSTLLADRRKWLTSNGLGLSQRCLDAVHVPLGLIERKQQSRLSKDAKEPIPEMGSQFYQQPETKGVKRFEHEVFLHEVVQKQVAGKHIAIIGEPGAGKTTLLIKIGEWLLEHPEDVAVVAWISLADVQGQGLGDYFYGNWLKQVNLSANPSSALVQQLQQQVEARKVWLLLDGLDEMATEDSLRWIDEQLRGWGQNLRVVLTCRLNQWDGSFNQVVDRFEVFKTLDYDYALQDQVGLFMKKWFAAEPGLSVEVAAGRSRDLRRALDEPGKERIKDLVKNPLRLTLFCAGWNGDGSLPETQAELYQGFVDYFYRANEAKFKDNAKKKAKLNQALGDLAKLGLNRTAGRRFRFTTDEMEELWQDDELTLGAVKQLGWLNCVGNEGSQKVYAFFHPTFQEYFAACGIQDWDYFLPRVHVDQPVACNGENVPTYRVFRQQWRQVILLWIGRNNVQDKIKEDFIEKLTNFSGGEWGFYNVLAFFVAAICIGEFKFSQQAIEIVRKLVEYALGRKDPINDCWKKYTGSLEALARKIIFFVPNEYAILTIRKSIELMDEFDNNTWFANKLLESLIDKTPETRGDPFEVIHNHRTGYEYERNLSKHFSKVGNNVALNNEAAKTLESLLKEGKSDAWKLLDGAEWKLFNDAKWKLYSDAKDLLKGGAKNEIAIDIICQLLERDETWDMEFPRNVIDSLGIYGVGSQRAIDCLLKLFERCDLGDRELYVIKESLIRIAVNNLLAISRLSAFLALGRKNMEKPDFMELASAAEILTMIDPGNQEAVSYLINILQWRYLEFPYPEDYDGKYRLYAERVLLSNLKVGMMPYAVQKLKACIYHCEGNVQFLAHKEVLFYCAQNLDYEQFYRDLELRNSSR